MLAKFFKLFCLLTLASALMTSCGGDGPLVLGEYRGEKDNYVEIIVLKGDGTYQHNVALRGVEIFSHSGTYSTGDNEVVLSRFTQVYDPVRDSMNSEMRLFESQRLTYMNLRSQSILKANLETEYVLYLKVNRAR